MTGKSLQGVSPANSSSTYIDDTSKTGRTVNINGGTMENVTLIGGTIDGSPIGADLPDEGNFTELVVGTMGNSGPVTFWGDLDTNYVTWDGDAAMFNINGGLTVRDGAELGNIIIHGNYIEAVRPVPNGSINLLAQPLGQVAIEGNFAHTAEGYIRLLKANEFQVMSSGFANIDASGSARLSSRNSSVTIATDYGTSAPLFIVNVAPYVNSIRPITNGIRVIVGVPHSYIAGDVIDISGTNSIPNIDGRYTIASVEGVNDIIIVKIVTLTRNGTQSGTVTKPLLGTIFISAGEGVQLNRGIPLRFGDSPRTQITTVNDSTNSMNIMTDFLTIDDPIPNIRIPISAQINTFSDAGFQTPWVDSNGVSRRGFFGFHGSTESFTWIPNATVTRNANGSKSVTGAKGIMSIEGLIGDPDLLLKAVRNVIIQPGTSIITPTGIPIKLGTSTLTPLVNNNLSLVTGGDFIVSPTVQGKGIVLPTNAPMFFNGSGGTMRIVGTPLGLNISSPQTINLDTDAGGVVHLNQGSFLQFGNDFFQRIYADSSGMNLESTTNINLRPNSVTGAVVVATNVKMMFGSDTDFIRGGGTGSGMTVQSSGQLTLGASGTLGNIVMHPFGGTVSSTGRILALPATANINFGTPGASQFGGISAVPGLVSVNSQHATGSVALNAGNNVSLIAGNKITLNSPLLDVPMNSRLRFGERGFIQQTPTSLNITTAGNDPLTVTASTMMLSGNLQVLGTITYIASTTTTFRDPIVHISRNPPLGDNTDKGVLFEWYEGPYLHEGAMYFDTSAQEFVLGKRVTNINEILTAEELGNLRVGNISATGMTTGNFITNRIVGTPDLYLVADGGSIYMQPTRTVNIPQDIPIISGTSSFVNTANGWILNSPTVNIASGDLTFGFGSTSIKLTDVNNLRIGGVPNVLIDSNLLVKSTIGFGTEQVRINVDGDQNLVLTAPSGSDIILTSNAVMNSGMTMGNAQLQWSQDIPGGRVIWRNTSTTTPLYLSLMGYIYDAEWRGAPISSAYGGTGHLGAWRHGSVVFAEASSTTNYLNENNDQFFWDNGNLRLGLRSKTPSNTLTIGAGHAELVDITANVYFKHENLYAYGIGKVSTVNLFSLKTTSIPSTSTSSLVSLLTVTPFGNVGLGVSDVFMQSLGGATADARLYINGSLNFRNFADKLAWSATQYITTLSDGSMRVYARTSVDFHASTTHLVDARFLETTSRIYGTAGGRLHLTSTTGTYFRAPHNVFVGKCCFYHDPVTDTCYSFIKRGSESDTEALFFSNVLGNIIVDPLDTLNLVGQKSLTFGNISNVQGRIVASGDNDLLVAAPKGNLLLQPNTAVRIDNGKSLVFSTPSSTSAPSHSTSLVQNQNTQRFEIEGDSQLALYTPSVLLNDNSPLYFGSNTRYIVSDGQSIKIVGGDEFIIDTNIVRMTGNLIVEGTTTQRFFTEVALDSGVIQLGGANNLVVTGMAPRNDQNLTEFTTSSDHRLVVGDIVSISNTNPDVDGSYTITMVPTNTTFVVPLVMPNIDIGSPIRGNVRSLLVANPQVDVGTHINWHVGNGIVGTSGSKIGFFGFDRSTQRFTFFLDATYTNGQYSGILGDAEFRSIYATNLAVTNLITPMNTGTNAVSGSNFIVSGGTINNTPIGLSTPSVGYFTNLYVSGGIVSATTDVINNFNADMVDGKHANEFIWRDGTMPLTANWNAGGFTITSGNLASIALETTQVVFSGSNGVLTGNDSFTFLNGDTLSVGKIGAFTLAGNVTGNDFTISNADFSSGNVINSNITLELGNTLDVSAGSIVFANNQISGNWIAGGIADIDISGTASLVTNGVYTHNFDANTILKADFDNTPVPLIVGERTIVGRATGGVITALTAQEARDVLNVSERGTENVADMGALMRDGSLSLSLNVGRMNGALFVSHERVIMQSNENVILNPHKQVTYISVLLNANSNTAVVNIPAGLGDGHTRTIVVTSISPGARLRIIFNYLAPSESIQVQGLWAYRAGASVTLLWDNVAGIWIGTNAGMFVKEPTGSIPI